MKLVKIVIFIFLAMPVVLYGQRLTSDTIQLEEFLIEGNRGDLFSGGIKGEQIDSLRENFSSSQTVSDVLERESTIYLKSYGLKSLATTSFRGASTSQTAVLWNGFLLQSPMNGVSDLALLPSLFVDQLKIQYGGCSALWGSGAISGSIHLENKPQYNKGFDLSLQVNTGSFGMYAPALATRWSSKKWIVSAKSFYSKAENNFKYRNEFLFGEPQLEQSNAQVVQYGYLLDNYFKISKKGQLAIRYWYQHSDRNIPPIMTVINSLANQKDWFQRMSIDYEQKRRFSNLAIKFAYFNEHLLFTDLGIDAKSQSKMVIVEPAYKLFLKKFLVYNVGLNTTYSEAMVSNYSGVPTQTRVAVFSSLNYLGKSNKITVTIRKEELFSNRMANSKSIPFMPYFGFDYDLPKNFQLKFSVGRNYRLPTFNDLYWTPGGNPNLVAEQGWSQEAGLSYALNNDYCGDDSCSISKGVLKNIKLSVTVFNRLIDNWIAWVPVGSYWEPQNILQVWSRGTECSAKSNWKIHAFSFTLSAQYDYVLSTQEKVAPGNETALGKQLIYVPLHKAILQGAIGFKKFEIDYGHHYTGWVYTLADNEAFLKGFWLGRLSLSKKITLNRNTCKLYFTANNLWNKSYQVIAYRAMPGRNVEFGIILNLNKQ